MPWINEVKNASKALVLVAKKTSKGVILTTCDYDAFLWNNSKLCRHLLEALEYWHENGSYGFELWIVPDKKAKLGFSVELGKESTYFVEENLWTIDESYLDGENPFIKATIIDNRIHAPNPLMREVEKQGAKDTMAAYLQKTTEYPLEAPAKARKPA